MAEPMIPEDMQPVKRSYKVLKRKEKWELSQEVLPLTQVVMSDLMNPSQEKKRDE